VRFLKIAIASRADSMLKEEKRKARGTNTRDSDEALDDEHVIFY
jgi:hypothetical protein